MSHLLLILIGIFAITYHIYDMYIGQRKRFYYLEYVGDDNSITPHIVIFSMGIVLTCMVHVDSYVNIFIFTSIMFVTTLQYDRSINSIEDWVTNKFYDNNELEVRNAVWFLEPRQSTKHINPTKKQLAVGHMQMRYMVDVKGYPKVKKYYRNVLVIYFTATIVSVIEMINNY